MTTYKRQDLKANGQDVKTVKSLSPCAYCELTADKVVCGRCAASGNYSEFSGMEAVLVDDKNDGFIA